MAQSFCPRAAVTTLVAYYNQHETKESVKCMWHIKDHPCQSIQCRVYVSALTTRGACHTQEKKHQKQMVHLIYTFKYSEYISLKRNGALKPRLSTKYSFTKELEELGPACCPLVTTSGSAGQTCNAFLSKNLKNPFGPRYNVCAILL